MKFLCTLLITVAMLPLYSQVNFTGYLVNEDNSKLKDVTVKLYSDNEVVSIKKWSKKFDYQLELEKYYTLELIKEGFATKRIAISTFEGDKGAEPFMFVMELVKAKEGDDIDDFPTALIKYKKNEGNFNFDVKYSKNRKKAQKLAASK